MLVGKRKKELDYFDYFAQVLDLCEQEVVIVQMSIARFYADKLQALIHEVHMLEHRADDLKRQMLEQLMREFLPPIDREDIMKLADLCDNIADGIDDLPLHLYMYNIRTCRSDANTIMDGMVSIVTKTRELMNHFHQFKQPEVMITLIEQITKLEEDGDEYYLKAMHNLFADNRSSNLPEFVAWKDTYDKMEDCYDACEDVAEVVRNIVIKNS